MTTAVLPNGSCEQESEATTERQPTPRAAARRPPLIPSTAASHLLPAAAIQRTAPFQSQSKRLRDNPHVDWERSLQHFAHCIYLDMKELNQAFVSSTARICFATFKQLWRNKRMSASFHVEFWESTPAKTHQVILQQALDLVCECIYDARDVLCLIGAVYGLYCAYMTQLGSPKHKVAVDPWAWAQLMQIEAIMMHATTQHRFVQAASEVLAMLSTLSTNENAFLKCVRGFGHDIRVHKRPSAVPSTRSAWISNQEEQERAKVFLETQQAASCQIEALTRRYADQLAALATKKSSGSNRRKEATLSSWHTIRASNVLAFSQELQTLTNELAQQQQAQQEQYEPSDEFSILRLEAESSRGSVARFSLVDEYEEEENDEKKPMDTEDEDEEDDALAELEAELSADPASSRPIRRKRPTTRRIQRPQRQATVTKALSIASSGVSSDALAELDAELEQEAQAERNADQESSCAARKKRPRARNKRPQRPVVTRALSVDSSSVTSDALAELEAELMQEAQVTTTRSIAAISELSEDDALAALEAELRQSTGRKRPAPDEEVVPVSRRTRQRAASVSSIASSVTESDGLSVLQAELDIKVETERALFGCSDSEGPDDLEELVDEPSRRRSTRIATKQSGIVPRRSPVTVQSSPPVPVSRKRKPTTRSTTTVSKKPTPVVGIAVERASMVSSDDGLADLLSELNAQPTTSAAKKKPATRAIKTTKTTRTSAKATRTKKTTATPAKKTRATATKTRKPTTKAPKPTASGQLIAPPAVDSDTESDGLADLMAELQQ